ENELRRRQAGEHAGAASDESRAAGALGRDEGPRCDVPRLAEVFAQRQLDQRSAGGGFSGGERQVHVLRLATTSLLRSRIAFAILDSVARAPGGSRPRLPV